MCPLDEFWQQIEKEGNLAKQLNNAIAIMERYAQGLVLPENKFKRISTSKEPVNQYEVKTADLRFYLFRERTGAIVVCGGKKSTQAKDIKRFKNLVKEYYEAQ